MQLIDHEEAQRRAVQYADISKVGFVLTIVALALVGAFAVVMLHD